MSTTNQTQVSKEKGVIQGIGFKEFSAICDEYQQVEKSTKELVSLANNPDTPIRVRVDIHKWVVEMNIGKPKQMNDISIQGSEKTEFKIFSNLGSDNIVKAISKKYSIPYEELSDFEQKVSIEIQNIEYREGKDIEDTDIDKLLESIN